MAAAPHLLVCTRTTAYRHDSIPAAVAAVRTLGPFEVTATEDPAAFERPLTDYAAVVFLSTSGEILTPTGREHLAAYVESGGGFVGVHAAACTEYDWPYYGDLLGARFAQHPAYQPGKAVVEDDTHPATQHLPAVWQFTDEWYDFRTNPGVRSTSSSRPTNPRTREAGWAPTTPGVVPPEGRRARLLHVPGPRLGGLRGPGLPRTPPRRDQLGGGAGLETSPSYGRTRGPPTGAPAPMVTSCRGVPAARRARARPFHQPRRQPRPRPFRPVPVHRPDR